MKYIGELIILPCTKPHFKSRQLLRQARLQKKSKDHFVQLYKNFPLSIQGDKRCKHNITTIYYIVAQQGDSSSIDILPARIILITRSDEYISHRKDCLTPVTRSRAKASLVRLNLQPESGGTVIG